ncbi:MAG: hypothetical protein HXY23_12380 [Parvularculaceae bacterium]|nr:hypothetical protein [Parvularculaceae bacterium]
MSEIELSAASLKPETADDSPFPLAVCWAFWISAALGLWALVIFPFV